MLNKQDDVTCWHALTDPVVGLVCLVLWTNELTGLHPGGHAHCRHVNERVAHLTVEHVEPQVSQILVLLTTADLEKKGVYFIGQYLNFWWRHESTLRADSLLCDVIMT